MSQWSTLSKIVGWDKRTFDFPTRELVLKKYGEKDYFSILSWYRFLHSPVSVEQRAVMTLLVRLVADIRHELEGGDAM